MKPYCITVRFVSIFRVTPDTGTIPICPKLEFVIEHDGDLQAVKDTAETLAGAFINPGCLDVGVAQLEIAELIPVDSE